MLSSYRGDEVCESTGFCKSCQHNFRNLKLSASPLISEVHDMDQSWHGIPGINLTCKCRAASVDINTLCCELGTSLVFTLNPRYRIPDGLNVTNEGRPKGSRTAWHTMRLAFMTRRSLRSPSSRTLRLPLRPIICSNAST